VVVQTRPFLAPGELAGQLHQNERLDHGSGRSVGLAEARGVLAEQVRGNASVDEGQLGRADGPLGLAG
jgi:hypothetical protein